MSMENGEKVELTVESDYGYGDEGRPPSIPGYATMIFTVELLAINGRKPDLQDPLESSTPTSILEPIYDPQVSDPV